MGLQELAYRCFPGETVKSMRKKFDLAASRKPIVYQLCAANLVYLLQHHICAPSEKIRLRICLNKKRIVNAHKDQRTDKKEMILRCEHDIPLGSIKKLFAQKLQLQISSLNLFCSDTLSVKDEDTVGDLVLSSGGFDIHSPVIVYACLRDDEQEEEIENSLPPLDDEMPTLELESYEADAPSPLLPILEPELPTTSTQAFEPIAEPVVEPLSQEQIKPLPEVSQNAPSTPTFQQMTNAKRKSAFEEVRPAKIRKTTSRSELPTQSPTTPNDFISFFNLMSSTVQQQRAQMPNPSVQSSASSIFAPASRPPQTNHSEPSIFNKPPTFPFMTPELAMAFQFQMLANGSEPALKQQPKPHMPMPSSFTPQDLGPQQNSNAQLATLQKSMVDAQAYNEFWTRYLQMNGNVQQKPNVKKPGATVKPMRRESYKPTPTTPTDQRPDKDTSLEGYKEGGNGATNEGGDHLHQFLTCAKI